MPVPILFNARALAPRRSCVGDLHAEERGKINHSATNSHRQFGDDRWRLCQAGFRVLEALSKKFGVHVSTRLALQDARMRLVDILFCFLCYIFSLPRLLLHKLSDP